MATIRTAIQLQDRFTPVIRSMSNALNITLSSFEALQRASHNAVDTASIQTARQELARAEIGINEVEQGIREANSQQQQFNNTVRSGGSAVDGMAGKIKSMVGAYIGLRTLQAGMDATDTYANNTARLSLIVEQPKLPDSATEQEILNASMSATAELQDKIFAAAQRSRGEYDAMTSTVAKLGLLAGDAFNNNDELVAFSELMNKSFKVSGADATESANAMYQLTQAMASGRLQGDEFRSIIENAPMLANAISEYTGVGQEGLKDLASDGAISADIIKAALFSASDDIESKFAQLPMTFSSIWVDIKNTAVKEARGLMQELNGFINSDTAAQVISGIKGAVIGLIATLGVVVGMVMDVSGFFVDNWGIIEPIIWGIVAALGIYTGAILANNIVGSINTGIQTAQAIAMAVKTGTTVAEAAATSKLTIAQWALNSALLASPITWIIFAIIALVAIFYAAVGAVNKFAGTSLSATGMIAGAFMVAAAAIGNVIIAMANIIIDCFVIVWNFIAAFVEFFANIFNDPIGSIVRLFADMADTVLGILEGIASAIDTLFGSNLVGAVSGWRSSLKGMVTDLVGEAKIKVPRMDAESLHMARFDYGEAYDSGHKFGEGIEDKVGSMFTMPEMDDPRDNPPDYSSMLGETADNTGKMSDALDTSEEDLKYLRDIAERESINRYTTAEIKVDMGGVNNTVSSNMDLDGIADYLAITVEEQMQIAAEGVHE